MSVGKLPKIPLKGCGTDKRKEIQRFLKGWQAGLRGGYLGKGAELEPPY